ncbi:MAG: hypothetical protein E7018_00940 [Alphaproteobacteria bacterium]|nr:hypothetical protein [Alphaproteobacteria bacterium]
MDDISLIIKEAKPLYFARKRRRNAIKSIIATVAIMWVGVLAYNPVSHNSYHYYWDTEFAVSDTPSCIEEMGLPTDEYGLLLVG